MRNWPLYPPTSDKLWPWGEYQALSDQISACWITFAHTGDPSDESLSEWPEYSGRPDGLSLVMQTEAHGGLFVEDDTYRLAGREYRIDWTRRRHCVKLRWFPQQIGKHYTKVTLQNFEAIT